MSLYEIKTEHLRKIIEWLGENKLKYGEVTIKLIYQDGVIVRMEKTVVEKEKIR